MKRKNIFIKNITLIIMLFVYCAFSSPNVNLISPYIVRGFSKTYTVSYHPETIIGYYDVSSYPEEYTIPIYPIKTTLFAKTERFNTIGIKNKAEIGLSIFALPIVIGNSLFVRARYRTTINIYDKGDGNLFKNISISPFLGGSVNCGLIDETLCVQNYFGVSIGTRKRKESDNSFEIFASPSYSLAYYRNGFEFSYEIDGQNNFLVHSIDIPIGFRHIFGKRVIKFSIKSGVGLHLTLYETTLKNNSSYVDLESTYSFRSSPFSVFSEIGVHFGSKRYNAERRKQLNLEKEVLL